ncbi:hypothetical protein OIE62_00350 [Streptomyces scopuliridis]|uniref:Uncharacterized protein n=1 Tax=Streptomyces scopuliridis TaxID=452529 RepID=A0ACD4ZX75_9ACTN|nr:hypothetical protein [Streptomyces scopuliridis]WSB38373.1 hypothetical protein OG949_39920 [Streptomyces scopuliridis]WSC02815.1 hypothetical protein OG835_41480 [Streptomyces scopuliridis]WSC03651.1 hypothetical protein OIE62_00350 [Streptomyces scopuliridis]
MCALLAPGLLMWSTLEQALFLAGLLESLITVVAVRRSCVLRLPQGILAAAVAGAVLHIAVFFSRDYFACVAFGHEHPDCAVVPTAVEWELALYTQTWGLLVASVVALLATLRYDKRAPRSDSLRPGRVDG